MIDGIFALIAALLCRGDARMRVLCIFFAIPQLVLYFVPAAPLGVLWYALCLWAEVVIVIGALLIGAPASRFIAWMSGAAVGVHLWAALEFPTDAILMYTAYPYLMNFIEASQVCALIFFSPPFLSLLCNLWIRLHVRGGDWPWTLGRYRYG